MTKPKPDGARLPVLNCKITDTEICGEDKQARARDKLACDLLLADLRRESAKFLPRSLLSKQQK